MRIILLLLFCPVLAFAEVHKCVNDGKITYTQERCVSGAAVYDAARASIGESRVSSVTLLRGANGVFNLSGFVNGKSADFIVDTGAARSTLTGVLAYSLGLRACVPVSLVSTANGFAGLCRVTVSSLSVAGLELSNVTVDVSPNMRGNSLIGNDLLSRFTVFQKNGVLTLSH